MAALETRHLTILLTDIKGFTDKTSHQTRAAIQAMLDEHRAIVLPILQDGGGQLVKTIGDAFLMTFSSPTNAVLAGVAVQEALAKRNEGRIPDDKLEIRIAINSGEVNIAEGDVFGEAVNITARIEGIAEANQVYFTEAVYLAMNKNEVPSSEVGLMQLKGIPEKIRVYKVRREDPIAAVSAAAPERHGLARFLPPLSAAAAPAAFGPGVKAVPAASLARPKWPRRAIALAIDGAICSTLLSSFAGGGHHKMIHIRKKPAAPAAAPSLTTDDKGANFSAGNSKVRFDDKGIHGNAGDVNIALDASGLHVTKPKPEKVIYESKSGVTASVDEDVLKDEDEDDSLLKGLLNGAWDFAIIWAIYNLMFLKWLSGSPGKMLMKLRVVGQNGEPLDKRQRLVRAAVSVISMHVAGLGYIWGVWEPQGRTWHDLAAGTRVVPVE
jgi:class 3 adenylate cyclase